MNQIATVSPSEEPEDKISDVPCPPWVKSCLPEFEALDNEAIVSRFRDTFLATVAQLARMGAMLWTLERRGYDLTELRNGMMKYVREIAYGRIVPELVAEFQAYPVVLRVASRLSPPEQIVFSRNDPMKVVVPSGDSFSHRLIAPSEMNLQQVHQVIGDGKFRTELEQAAYLRSQAEKTPHIAHIKPTWTVRAKPAGIVMNGPGFIPLAELKRAVEGLVS